MSNDFDNQSFPYDNKAIEKLTEKLKNDDELREEFIKASLKKHYPILKLFVLIVDAEKSMKAAELFDIARVRVLYQFRAEGTASSEMLDLLGIGGSYKMVLICIAPDMIINDLLMIISKKFRLKARGNGIAFTIPVTGAASHIMKLLDEDLRKKIRQSIEGEVSKMNNKNTHELILAVVNPGYSEALMEAAKEAGATGGTIVHARQVGREPSTKAWGISILGEKEIISIITAKDKKIPIMKAINTKFGIKSEAHGITISVPVDAVEGLEDDDD